MKIPRDLSGKKLIAKLEKLGYRVTRQTGSHVRLSIRLDEGEKHVTIPRHSPLRIGTLNSILTEVTLHLKLPREELIKKIK